MTTVGDVITTLSGLLSNPMRTFEDCVLAQAVADRINNSWTLVACPMADDPTASGATTVLRPRVERLAAPSVEGAASRLVARPIVHSPEELAAAEAARAAAPSVIKLRLARPDIAPVPAGR